MDTEHETDVLEGSFDLAARQDAADAAISALRGDVVYTGDTGDLEKLRAFFPGVRVLAV